MKKTIAINLVISFIVIVGCNYYFESKANGSIAYFYAEQYVADKYEIDVSELIPGEIEYYFGMGLYEVEVINNSSNTVYFFEVDISKKDHSLLYLYESTDFGN